MLDFYDISGLFTPEERQVQNNVREFLETEVVSHITEWWEQGVFPSHLIAKFGELGMLGTNYLNETRTNGLSSISRGLVMYELERADSGLRSFASVQTSLVMYPIHKYGSEEQRLQYLPELAKGELIGCFALTEHEGGSDPRAMQTRARKSGNNYVINGTKMWISNGGLADIAVVWAKDDEENVRGFIVPTNTPGFKSNPIKRKMSMRLSETSELVLQDVRLTKDQVLPNADGLSAALSCLTQARYGIAWGAMGALEAVYSEAINFAKVRQTFGKPIAARQLIQTKLVDMLSDHTRGLLIAWRLGKLMDEGSLNYSQVSLAKRENVRSALTAARAARGILGASGITMEYDAIRHMLNLETVDTYEGTHDIHTLLLGREITGIDALQ